MTTPDEFAPLVNVSQEDLKTFFESSSTNLTECIARLVKGLDDPDGVISAFASFSSTP